MQVMVTIAGSMRRKNRSGCPRNDFLEGGGYSGIPSFRVCRSSHASFARGDAIDNVSSDGRRCGRCHPCGRTERAHKGFGNLAENARFPQRPHRSLLLERREEQKNEQQISSNRLSTQSDQVHSSRGLAIEPHNVALERPAVVGCEVDAHADRELGKVDELPSGSRQPQALDDAAVEVEELDFGEP
jgi:hypothetical protein